MVTAIAYLVRAGVTTGAGLVTRKTLETCRGVTIQLRASALVSFTGLGKWWPGRVDGFTVQSRSDQGSGSDRALEWASRFFAYAKNAPGSCLSRFELIHTPNAPAICIAKSGFAEHSGKITPLPLLVDTCQINKNGPE
jgi:hypothetical protein